MQRIDENTYIDDTLVTCAEYQLFIDEMREQGKYLQPEHWTTYQFPGGQARDPILGVRHSDAEEFCEWLTIQEGKEWKFRLPSQSGANAFPMKPLGKSPLGYWIDEKYQFAWVGSVPKDARTLHSTNLNFDHARTRSLDYARDLALELDQARAHLLYLEHAYAQASDHTHARSLDLIRAIELEYEPTIKLAREQVSKLESMYRGYDRIDRRRLDLNLDNANSFALELVLALERAHVRALDLDYRMREPNHKRDLDNEFLSTFYSLLNPQHYHDPHKFDNYVDIFTLQERILGRSPAFEGIRLVKYRE